MRAVASSVAARTARVGVRTFVRPTTAARMGHGHHVRRPRSERVPPNHRRAARPVAPAGPLPVPRGARH